MEDYSKQDILEKLLTIGFKNRLFPKGFQSDDIYEHLFFKNKTSYKLLCSFTGIKINLNSIYTMPYLDIQIPLIDNYWIDIAHKINIQFTKYKPTITILPIIECPHILEEPWYEKIFHGIEAKADKQGVENLLNHSFQVLENCMLPAAEKYLDLRLIDGFVNTEIKYLDNVQGFLGTEGTVFKRLIIAKLVGNPIYNQMITTYRGGYEWYLGKGKEPGSEFWGNYPEVFETLFKRLEKVQPLANTVLS